MAKQNSVKVWLESSPWVLISGAIAAVLTFIIAAADKGLVLYERWKAPPQLLSIEIAQIGGYLMVKPTKEMAKIPAIKSALRVDSEIPKMMEGARPATGQVPLWPIHLLVLNSQKERGNLHSCKMFVRLPGAKFPVRSTEYFVSKSVEFNAEATGRPIVVEAARTDRATVVFLFPGLDATTFTEPKFFETPAVVEVACQDQVKREISTTREFYHSVRPGSDRRPVLRRLR